MKTCKRTSLNVLAGLAFSVISLPAAVIVDYTFTGSTLNPTTEATDTSAGAFLFGPGLGTFGTDHGISGSAGNPAPAIYIRSNVTTLPVSPTSTDYVGFSITADPGFHLNLSSLAFDYGYSGGDSTESATFTIRSSVNGFISDLGSYTAIRDSSVSFTTTSPQVDLSAPAFSGLTSVEFRIYLTDTNNSGTSILRMDNVILIGDVVPIPEPAIGAMLLTGGLLALIRRRRGAS